MSAPASTDVENFTCAECGMYVETVMTFHPGLHCWLFSRGVVDPGKFLREWGFIPDPSIWGNR
jgi:hypothetical protein